MHTLVVSALIHDYGLFPTCMIAHTHSNLLNWNFFFLMNLQINLKCLFVFGPPSLLFELIEVHYISKASEIGLRNGADWVEIEPQKMSEQL